MEKGWVHRVRKVQGRPGPRLSEVEAGPRLVQKSPLVPEDAPGGGGEGPFEGSTPKSRCDSFRLTCL